MREKSNLNITKLLILTFLLTASICLVWLLKSRFLRTDSTKIVKIYQDGTLIRSFELSDSASFDFTITDKTGTSYNTVTVKDGKIAVTETGCPDKICVKTGFTDSPLLPIVCLPNRLVIQIEDAPSSFSE